MLKDIELYKFLKLQVFPLVCPTFKMIYSCIFEVESLKIFFFKFTQIQTAILLERPKPGGGAENWYWKSSHGHGSGVSCKANIISSSYMLHSLTVILLKAKPGICKDLLCSFFELTGIPSFSPH